MTLTEPELGAYIVAFLRVVGLAATAPVLGEGGVPMRARLVVTVAIALCVGANRPGVPYVDVPAVGLLELAFGLVTGLTARFVLAKVAVAGQLMGLSLGLGFASEYDVKAGENAGILRTILATLAGLAFVQVGGLDALVRGAAGSPARISDIGLLGPALVDQATSALGAGLTIAAPIVIASFVANIGFAVLNRAAPAVNVFSVALTGVLIVGGIVLVAGAPGLVGNIEELARTAARVIAG